MNETVFIEHGRVSEQQEKRENENQLKSPIATLDTNTLKRHGCWYPRYW